MLPKHNLHLGAAQLAARTQQVIPGLGVDVPELQQARSLWQRNRFDESLELFEKAVRKYPQNLVALVDGSRALGARFEIARAEVLLDKLVKLATRNPELLHLAGQSYRMIFRPDKAIRCFEKVRTMSAAIPDTSLELAVMYERRHRLTDALNLIEDCLRAAPDYLEAELFKARLLRRSKDSAAAETIFRRLAANESAHPLIRAQAWNEIAAQLDRQGDYDSAMTAALKSKEFLRPDESPFLQESEVLQECLRSLGESLTAGHLKKWRNEAAISPPNKTAVLTSFPRSGTTLLEQVLDSHPGSISSDEREVFGRDIFPAMWRTANIHRPTIESLDNIPMERLGVQRERYLNYMSAALEQPIGDRVHIDKNPTMTLLLPGLLRLFPESKLLIALRDPRDVVVSCFMQYLPLNTNSVCFLTLERAARRYAHDMKMWRRFRELEGLPWLEIRYEDSVKQLEREARRALEFLNLPWDPNVLQYRERLKTKSVSSPTYEAVSQPLYTSAINRWKNYEKFFGPALEILQPSIEAFGY